MNNNLMLRLFPLIGGILPLASAIACVKCVLPKSRVKRAGDRKSLLLFDHIARRDQAEYLQAIGALGDDDTALPISWSLK